MIKRDQDTPSNIISIKATIIKRESEKAHHLQIIVNKAHLSDTPSHRTTIRARESELNPSLISYNKTKMISFMENMQNKDRTLLSDRKKRTLYTQLIS